MVENGNASLKKQTNYIVYMSAYKAFGACDLENALMSRNILGL